MQGQRENFAKVVDRARAARVTEHEREQRARAFVYGNVALENPRVTREVVDRVFEARTPKR